MVADRPGFGALLRRYRTAAGLTQEALAKRAGLSLRGVSDLERGLRRVPYPDTVERLAEALGLSAAERTVLRAAPLRRPAVACPPRAGPTTESRQPSFSLAGLIEVPLVGRTAQFDKLAELHHRARQGRAQIAVMEGESGIGKTRLADEFLRWAAAQGADILRGRAFETGGRLPYQPVVDAFRPCVERENAPEELLPDVWLAELTRLLPELREHRPNLPVPTGDEAAARTRLFEAVARLGHALSERAPLVLFIDDAQWADEASFDAMHYLVRRWADRQTRVLLLVSIRSEALAATPALGDWLLGLEHNTECAHLTLDPLTSEDVLGVVHGLAGNVGASNDLQFLANWLYKETGGQPFFLMETLKALLERGVLAPRRTDSSEWMIRVEPSIRDTAALRGFLPTGVRDVIRARLRWFSPTAQALIAAAAVLGQEFTFEQLCRVANLVESDGLSGLDEVLRGRLLGEDLAATYSFTHDKIRDVAYADAGAARRGVLHRRALEGLRDSAAPAARLAQHALEAGLLEQALTFSSSAGDHALRLLAARDAIEHYERALALAERLGRVDALPSLRARRGHAFASITRWPEARRDFEASLPGLMAEDRVEALNELAMVSHWLMDVPSMRRYATEALELGQTLARDDLVAGALGALAVADSSDGELAASLARCRGAFARAGGQRPAALVPVAQLAGLILYWTGHSAEAIARSQEAIEFARAVNDSSNMIRALSDLGLAFGASGRYLDALQAFEQARRFGQEYEIDTMTARAISMCGGLHLEVFDYEGAETLAEEAREMGRSVNWLSPVVSGGIDLLFSLVRRGEVGRTERLIQEVAEVAQTAAGAHGWLWRLRLTQARAEVALACADWDAAFQWSSGAVEQSVARGRPKYNVLGLAARAQALLACGHTVQAIGDLRAAAKLAKTTGDPALLLRVAAQLLELESDASLFAEARAAADRIAADLPDPLRQRFKAASPVQMLERLKN